jgi:predicted nucleic acid-binding protein
LFYVDTSALAKWYLNERRSEEFAAWMHDQVDTWISSLTLAELTSLLLRRQRDGELVTEDVTRLLATIDSDVADGFLLVRPIDDPIIKGARSLMLRLFAHPLRTVDAIHLAVIRALDPVGVATADRILALAAGAMGFQVIRFD